MNYCRATILGKWKNTNLPSILYLDDEPLPFLSSRANFVFGTKGNFKEGTFCTYVEGVWGLNDHGMEGSKGPQETVRREGCFGRLNWGRKCREEV